LFYLCKQIRFGENAEPVGDSAVMAGTGLSRNGVKIARESLMQRGWIVATNTSDDKTRPKWIYSLNLKKKNDQNGSVTARQLVSQRDSAVSQRDSAVSQRDSAVSQRDTCNKEEESTYRKPNIETTGDCPPDRVLIVAQSKFWEAVARQTADPIKNRDAEDMRIIHTAAAEAGVSYSLAKDFLYQHPHWRTWPYLKLVDSQQQIEFPAVSSAPFEITAIDAGRAVCELLGVNGASNRQTAKEACESVKRRKPDMRYESIPEFVVKLWKEYDSQPTHAKISLSKFLGEIGRFIDSDSWKTGNKPASGFKPATKTPDWALRPEDRERMATKP
jgi:hypothetical protein